MFLVENLTNSDRQQWLQGAWGLTRIKPSPSLVLTNFLEVGGATSLMRIRRYEAWNKYEEQVVDAGALECYCHWPLGGAINIPMKIGQVAGVLSRRTERQYRRTFVPDLMTLEFPK